MKPHHYLAIFVRLFSIALFLLAIKQSFSFFYLLIYGTPQGLEVSIFQIFVSFLLPLSISIILWFFPVLAAKFVLKPEIDQNIEVLNKQSIFSVLVSVLGLYVTFYAVVDATYYFTLWQFANSPDNYGSVGDLFGAETKANMWATGVELGLGFVIMLKSKSIAKQMFKIAS